MSNYEDPLGDVQRTGDAVQSLVDGVRADQWSLSTPCTEWDVRHLVNHVAQGNLRFTALAKGKAMAPPTPEERARDAASDVLGDDPPASFAAVRRDMMDAFSAEGFLERTFNTPIGEQTGAGVCGMRTTEMLAHGWDLARATGQPVSTLPDDIAERYLERTRLLLDGRDRSQTPFGERQPAPDDASAIDRFAAYMGRPL